ncbi:S8 family serine peptidase [Aliikangiella marina]|uniref:S8 family serine peptidase n=1 Tax=Aliikangiella marina TaxID=1712262 RepID=A0A545TD31_9GAMM|nr:S8 family serine peptidase [Aliikangiella marina]TQV75132.1 S8 family serine peptidase [Aliikangiella marina]
MRIDWPKGVRIIARFIALFTTLGLLLDTNSLTAAESRASQQAAEVLPRPSASKPEILKINLQSCVKLGQQFTIEGKNLGNGRNLSLYIADTKPALQLNPISWSTRRIVTVNTDTSLIEFGRRYQLGIRKKGQKAWLTKSKLLLEFCRPPNSRLETASGEPATVNFDSTTAQARNPNDDASASRQPPTSNARIDEGVSRNVTDYVDRSGSLMGRSLPSPPQVRIAPPPSKSPDFEPNQLVVLSADMQEANKVSAELRNFNIRVKSRKKLTNLGLVISVFRTPQGEDLVDLANQIRAQSPDIWVDFNHHYQLLADPRHSLGQKMVDWPESCNKPARVGQLDTQVNLQHPSLNSKMITTKPFRPKNSEAVQDGHGNAIASLLVGNKMNNFPGGLLTQGHLFAADIFWEDSDKKYTSTEWIIKGLDWLVSQKVSVINMSFGGRQNLLLALAIDRVIQKNITVVAAAGNSGKDALPIYPAAFKNVIAVTAIDKNQNLYKKANRGDYIDFAAPGVAIWTAHKKNGFKYQQGTSFAAPFVTAMAAVSDIETLKNSSIDLGEPGRDKSFGWGLIKINDECN